MGSVKRGRAAPSAATTGRPRRAGVRGIWSRPVAARRTAASRRAPAFMALYTICIHQPCQGAACGWECRPRLDPQLGSSAGVETGIELALAFERALLGQDPLGEVLGVCASGEANCG